MTYEEHKDRAERHVATVEAQSSIASYSMQALMQWFGRDLSFNAIKDLPMYGRASRHANH